MNSLPSPSKTTKFSKIWQAVLSQAIVNFFLFFGLFLGLTAIFLSNPTPSLAQEKQSLIAIPDRLGAEGTLTAKPGEVIQTNVRFHNASNKPLTIISKAQDFIVKEDGSTPIPVEDTVSNRWSLASWMVITPSLHTVQPKKTVEMQVVFEVPEDATPGGHYAMILHQPTDDPQEKLQDQELTGSGVSQRVGTLVYFIVEGHINEEAYLRNFKFKSFQEFGPVPFSYQVSNQSDIHIHPRMKIDIFNMLGKKIDSIEIETKNIFPFNRRDFSGEWNRTWGLGLYKAELSMSYGDTGQVAVDVSKFWIVPIRIILAILLLLLLIAAAISAIKRHVGHKVKQEKDKVENLQKQIEDLKQSNSDQTPPPELTD